MYLSVLSCPGGNYNAMNAWYIPGGLIVMHKKDEAVGTLRTTYTQGKIIALLTEVLLTNCSCPEEARAFLSQVDMTTSTTVGFREGDTPSVEEVGDNEFREVLTVVIGARFYMYRYKWNNPVIGSVEAKLRLFREGRYAPWKLHYVMLILPHLSIGKKPSMYVVRDFTHSEQLEGLLRNPGRFYKEHASHEAVNRSVHAPNLLRVSKLMLGESVQAWEVLHPEVAV